MNIGEIENALIKRYRNKLWKPFIKGVCQYGLISEGDTIAVCISGGKDSFTLAKLFQEYEKHGSVPIKVKYLVMDPGFNEENITKLKTNAEVLGIPIIIKQSDIFKVAENHGGEQPCYLCARMRRGFLYKFAQEQGCNKIALGHHFNDVIETVLLNILYAGCYKTMVPKLKSTNFIGMELIRPMVFIEEKNIINYMRYCEIETMNCGCKVAAGEIPSKRKEVKALISEIKKRNPDVDKSIYKSTENVNLGQILGWKENGKNFSFLDFYNNEKSEEEEL